MKTAWDRAVSLCFPGGYEDRWEHDHTVYQDGLTFAQSQAAIGRNARWCDPYVREIMDKDFVPAHRLAAIEEKAKGWKREYEEQGKVIPAKYIKTTESRKEARNKRKEKRRRERGEDEPMPSSAGGSAPSDEWGSADRGRGSEDPRPKKAPRQTREPEPQLSLTDEQKHENSSR